jgi:hypothetical protein
MVGTLPLGGWIVTTFSNGGGVQHLFTFFAAMEASYGTAFYLDSFLRGIEIARHMLCPRCCSARSSHPCLTPAFYPRAHKLREFVAVAWEFDLGRAQAPG